SANGPGTVVTWPPDSCTRALSEVGTSPPVSSMVPSAIHPLAVSPMAWYSDSGTSAWLSLVLSSMMKRGMCVSSVSGLAGAYQNGERGRLVPENTDARYAAAGRAVAGSAFTGNAFTGNAGAWYRRRMAADLLARLLREWRGRITLAQVGLPERRVSRTGTLTQEDLAHLTGYSVRAISALEQGVPHRATPELVDALAAALRLSPDERHTLWYLAAGMPPPASAPLPAGIDPGLARLVEVTDPHPAFVADAARRILAQNQAAADWFNLLDMP